MLRVWDAALARPTRDIDFMGRIENTPEAIGAAVRECLAVEDVDDGLTFTKDIGRQVPVEVQIALTNEYVEQDTTARMWRTNRTRLAACGIEAPTDLSVVVDVISAFLMPPARAAAASKAFAKTWTPRTGWA